MKNSLSQFSVLSFFVILIGSCGTTNEKIAEANISNKKGLELMESKCYACHNPKTGKNESLAPPMIEVKNYYLEKFKSKDLFVSNFVDFALEPTDEKAIIRDAVDKYELMANMNLEAKELRIIAEYIYNNKIEEPSWFANQKKDELPVEGINLYKKKGLELALKTKKILGKNLMGQINKNGTSQAVSFCSEKAFPIVDSMSTVLGARIKRVSDLPRNSNNLAKGDELKYIESMKNRIINNEKPTPAIKEEDEKMVGYYPIMTNQMCMQCHGTPEKEILTETRTKIRSIYPKDLAFGYSPDQLRGIWVVEMNK